MTRYRCFDRDRIELRNLGQRGHYLTADDCLALDEVTPTYQHPELAELVQAIVAARTAGRPVVVMLGGHPIKLGLAPVFIDLMRHGWITHVATNGAGIIHDFELALCGGTSEDVARWIQAGQFGLWEQTGRLNEIISEAAARDEGLGEAVGRVIVEEKFPNAHLSLVAAGWKYGVPVTSHVGIGSDIIHAHANCDGAALGAASYTDFLIFTDAIERLEGGVFLNIGSAVTGPEVYLKSLAMARNVARQSGRSIRQFTTAVFDLIELPENFRTVPPPPGDPLNFFRPWKTILVRTVADGGQSYYFCGDHRHTIPTLWHTITQAKPQALPRQAVA